MKKIKKLLIIMLLLIPCFVKADMGAPMLREFEVVVVNPEGVDYEPNEYVEEATGHLNKDEVVIVMSEFNNKYDIAIKKATGEKVSIGSIKSFDGFSIVQDEVDPTKTTNDNSITKFDTKQKAIVYNEKGVSIYQGPSKIYKVVGSIKKGTKLEYEYAIDGEGGITYIYVEYNGKKGWVEILNKNVLIENKNQYIFRVDVDSECGVIPKNTIITPEYSTDRWSKAALFEYKKCKTLLNTFRSEEVMPLYKATAKSKIDIPVYEDSDKTNIITTIPANTEFKYYTGTDSQMGTIDTQYVEYDGKRGWSFATYDDLDINYGEMNNDTGLKDTKEKEAKKEIKKETEVNKKNSNKILNLNSKEFIVVCAGGAVVLSLTALVIIVLVNKKKKSKNEVNNTQKEE